MLQAGQSAKGRRKTKTRKVWRRTEAASHPLLTVRQARVMVARSASVLPATTTRLAQTLMILMRMTSKAMMAMAMRT